MGAVGLLPTWCSALARVVVDVIPKALDFGLVAGNMVVEVALPDIGQVQFASGAAGDRGLEPGEKGTQ